MMLVKLPKLVRLMDDEPFGVMDIRPEFVNWDRVKGIRYLDEESRDTDSRLWDYDIPRVKFFYDMFKRGEIPDAVELDVWDDNKLSLNNGYHRAAGAILAKSPCIEADGATSYVQRKLERIAYPRRRS